MRHARFEIIQDHPPSPLVIRDVGPWDRHPTVTNDAEWVVEALVAQGRLPNGRRLWYYDSEGRLDEIIVQDGRFAGFAPAKP